ncbi:glycosyltransferase [Polynucleobacter sp. P1-05-14]|uniref:glycosyltransferase n=1 Tax=Polynucleobacter sp. P1-05-14 TaxID=1819732 RepID=UPI001C0E437C|nr:glycosyltransferase [Polynucleobacter sp. P1-05-14]MBU3548026.1 glycosyltransferase [Polynucleobacter sp. P1-05-14]
MKSLINESILSTDVHEELKILHVIDSVNPDNGGPIEGVNQLARNLSGSNVSITVVCSDKPDAPWLQSKNDLKIHALGPVYTSFRYNPRLVPWLSANAKSFDIIVVNGIWQYHGFAVQRVYKKIGIPYVVFTHGMLDPWFKKKYPFKHFKKWLFWPWSDYQTLKHANAVIFTCEEEKILARKSFWLYRANEIVCSYGTSAPPKNSHELSKKFLDQYEHLKGKRILLFLGRIVEKKGCDILIKAFAKISDRDPDLHLVIAGPDTMGLRAVLIALAEALGISNKITWTGMLQADDKWGAYYSSEVFCLPSHQENFGIVVAEALACGIPVLISNQVNIWREIQSYAAGFVDEDTEDGTMRNLNRWLSLDPVSFSNMKLQAELCFQSNFNISKSALNYKSILEGFKS